MISVEQSVYDCITKHALFEKGATVIVGLSGGPDSVFLLHMLCKMKVSHQFTIVAAHVDHGWRAESEKDVQFCAELCKKLGVRFVTQKLSDLESEIKFDGSREAYAREARRLFFERCAQAYGAPVIALGHHADDQQETFFIRLVRGASLTGLAVMRYKHGLYVRPLLDCSKDAIVAYLAQEGIAYLDDATNTSDAFLRNRIRNAVLPALQKVDSRVSQNLLQSIEQLQHADAYMEHAMQQIWHSIITQEGDDVFVDIAHLLAQPQIMRRRLLLHWLTQSSVPFTPTKQFFAEIERFLQMQGSKQHQVHTSWAIDKRKQHARIIKR